MVCAGIAKAVSEAVELYNRYRSPEAVARVLRVDEERGLVEVEFSGTFCMWCGVLDWVEDLAYVLRQLGYEAELVGYEEPGENETRRVGVFRVRVPECGDRG